VKTIEAAAADGPLQRLYVDDNVGKLRHELTNDDCRLTICAIVNRQSSIVNLFAATPRSARASSGDRRSGAG
jgi:hypothetical protein